MSLADFILTLLGGGFVFLAIYLAIRLERIHKTGSIAESETLPYQWLGLIAAGVAAGACILAI